MENKLSKTLKMIYWEARCFSSSSAEKVQQNNQHQIWEMPAVVEFQNQFET